MITGVMNATQAIFDDCFYSDHSVDLSTLAWEKEYRLENGLADDDDIPDDAYDMINHDETEYILGDWAWSDEENMYMIDHGCNGCGFAAVLGWLGGAPIVHVLWSETTKGVASMCSPCCPGQADLDSGKGNIIAYALPEDYDWDGE